MLTKMKGISADQTIMTENRGWILAKDIEVGDVIWTPEGWGTVKTVTPRDGWHWWERLWCWLNGC